MPVDTTEFLSLVDLAHGGLSSSILLGSENCCGAVKVLNDEPRVSVTSVCRARMQVNNWSLKTLLPGAVQFENSGSLTVVQGKSTFGLKSLSSSGVLDLNKEDVHQEDVL